MIVLKEGENVGKTFVIKRLLDERDKRGYRLYLCECTNCKRTIVRKSSILKEKGIGQICECQKKHKVEPTFEENINKYFNKKISLNDIRRLPLPIATILEEKLAKNKTFQEIANDKGYNSRQRVHQLFKEGIETLEKCN